MSDNQNQFVVDLGTVKLTSDQHAQINSAIQKAVAGELAHITVNQRIVLIPVTPTNRYPKWTLINGIIARLLDDKEAQVFI